MARPRGKSQPRSLPAEYHHGDLRRALVEATLNAIEADGAQGITLRGVARAAGVSHMAPYNHFADKAALLAAAAAAGFRRLRAAMEERMTRHPAGDPRRLQDAGIAYAIFAVENPELFRLMFGPELADKRRHEELAHAAQEVLGVLVGALAETGIVSGGPGGASAFAVTPWALVHGLAMLAVAGQLPSMDRRQIEVMAQEATDLLYDGLAHSRRPVPGGGGAGGDGTVKRPGAGRGRLR
jgi:AcrR family transcriptional regulator